MFRNTWPIFIAKTAGKEYPFLNQEKRLNKNFQKFLSLVWKILNNSFLITQKIDDRDDMKLKRMLEITKIIYEKSGAWHRFSKDKQRMTSFTLS